MFLTIPNGDGPSVGYGLGLLHFGNWIGHDGAIFGLSTVTMFEPKTGATITATANLASNFSTPTLDLFYQVAHRLYPDSFEKTQPEELAATIEATMQKYKIPGAIVGVWQQDKPAFERGFGVADKANGAPMTTGLRMRI